jgi:hypothetical protein
VINRWKEEIKRQKKEKLDNNFFSKPKLALIKGE